MSKYYIGIMTGTSADSLDACLVSFENGFKFIHSKSNALPERYKLDYEESIDRGFKTTKESKKLKNIEDTLNKKTSQLVNRLLKDSNITKNEIKMIGFSGQTVFHTNEKSYQIGNSQNIANNTGINVMSDFRNYDIKNGGIGAPLIPAFHKYIYSEENKRKIIFNIGGIANGTYLDGENIVLASDVGPGNCLMDQISLKQFNEMYDKNGAMAAKGIVLNNLLDYLLKKSPSEYPRADDKQDYYKLINEEFYNENTCDGLRTLAEFTAEKIKQFYVACDQPEEIIFHGGGTKNIFLMNLLSKKISKKIKTTDEKIPSKFVEAAAFAYLAYKKKGKIFISK